MPPIVLKIKGSRPFLPFAELDSEEDLSKTWRVCTKVKDSLENGSRLENLSWRLWHLHQLVASGKRKLNNEENSDGASTSNTQSGTAGTSSSMTNDVPMMLDSIPDLGGQSVANGTELDVENKRCTFRTLSKNATRILDGDENADQRDFEMRVRHFSPSSGRSARSSKSPQVTSSLPTADNNSPSMRCPPAMNVQHNINANNNISNGSNGQFSYTNEVANQLSSKSNNTLWLQQACSMQANDMANAQASVASAAMPSANLPNGMPIPTRIMSQANQGRAITTTTNTMLPAPSAVYPPYQAYTAGNDLSQLMGAAASIFPQLMGIPGLTNNVGMANNAAPPLAGTAAGVLLDDMFGSFPASAYVGDVNQPPTIEIPLEQVLNANGINVAAAAAAAAAAANPAWSTASTPSATQDQMNTNYFDAWLNVASGRWPAGANTSQSTNTSPRTAAQLVKLETPLTQPSSATTSPNLVYNTGNIATSNRPDAAIPSNIMGSVSTSATSEATASLSGYTTPTTTTSVGGENLSAVVNAARQLLSEHAESANRLPVSPVSLTPASVTSVKLNDGKSSVSSPATLATATPAQQQPKQTKQKSKPKPKPKQQQQQQQQQQPQQPQQQSLAMLTASNLANSSNTAKSIFPTYHNTEDSLKLSTSVPVMPGTIATNNNGLTTGNQPINIMAKPSDHISLVTDPAQLFCRNCGVTSTPLWRRSINDDILCNACGLYMKLHNMARPKLRKAQQKDLQPSIEHCVNSSPIPGNNKSSVFCSNCYTNNTPLWRRDDQSNVLCNACGLYLKLHQERRPLSLKTDVIKKRQRYDTPKKSKKAKTGEEASEENSVENSPDQSSSGTSLQTTFMDTSSTEPSPCHSPSTQPIGLTSATYSPLQNQQQQHSLNMQIKQEPVLMNGNTGLTNLNGVDFQTAIQSANLYATNGWPTTTTAANANLLQPSTASTSGRNTPSKQQHTGVS